MADFSGIFGKPFPEQLAAWRIRLGELRPTAVWTDVEPQFHDRGFMVAGATKADLLADLAAAVDKAISQGRSLDEFRRNFRDIVQKRGWHGWTGEGTAKGEAWRTKVIYRTNMATTYAAGRRAQLVEGGFKFWVYKHGNAREPRLQHLAWDGIALPPDHPFWAMHSPPNGWGCTCRMFGANGPASIRAVGGDPDKPLPPGWDAIDPQTGTPKGIDRGWAYAPGATVDAEVVGMVSGKLPRLPAEIGAALFHTVRRPKDLDELTQEFGSFVDRALSSRIERNFMVVGALKPDWVTAARAAGLRPETAEIAVTDRAIQHTFRGTSHITAPSRPSARAEKVNPVDLGWYRDLPRHLLAPRGVLLDQADSEPVFVLVYDVPGRLAKLVVEINSYVKKAGGVLNLIQSGRLVQPNDLAAMRGRGAILVEGSI